MSAKPQPMAGQPDTADDLIAELAKLMAQDAKSDSPAETNTPTFAVRIPGASNASPDNASSPAPVPQFGFDRTIALAAERSPTAKPVPPPVPVTPKPEAAPEPFHFDFGLGGPKSTPAAPVQTEPPAASATPVVPAAPAMEAVSAADHDSIADLIAAELSATPAPAAELVPETPPAPVAPASSSSQGGADWSPTMVPANPGSPERSTRPALRSLDPQAQSKPEQDRFKVPPVFGLGTRPASVEPTVSPVAEAHPVQDAAPSLRQPVSAATATPQPGDDDGVGGDPIDEIENLIGRAMRVEFDKPAEPVASERPVPSPALRSLATPVAPAASPSAAQPVAHQSPAPHALSDADEAIFAAAQATGAEIDWVEPPEGNGTEAMPMARRRQRRGFGLSRSFAGPLVAVTLLLAAGFGLYWVLGLGRDSGPAPLLTADASPVKETPAVQPDAAAAQQSIVFNEINGVVPGAEEQLVSRDQADLNEVTQVPPPSDLSEEGLANRKVRTVTVRPDGTIVSGEDSVAGSTILPVDRPNVPAVPGAETASSELLASVEPEAATSAVAPATPEADVSATATPAEPAQVVPPVEPGSTVPAFDAAGNAIPGKTAPVPMLRPAGLAQTTAATPPTSPVNAVVDTPTAAGNLLPPPPTASTLGALPATQPAAAAEPPEAATTIPGAVEVEALPNSAPAYAQLASLRSEEEARQAAQNLVTRFGPLFGGANMEVQRVDLGARGVYYRVRVPAESVQAASNICTNVVAAGGDCVLM